MGQLFLRDIGPGGIHMIGIGGISMSALAELMSGRGIRITGSDMREGDALNHLRALGCAIGVPHGMEHLGNPELVVYTAAIPETNPELSEARRRGIRCMERAELLGGLMAEYAESIAISGTHGKTTTTSMMASVLIDARMNPTVHVGGLLDRIGGNLRVGSPDLFLTEACEYKDSFLQFHPTTAVVLNVEADHLDWFRDLAHIESSFAAFLSHVPKGGCIVLNADDAGCREVGRLIRVAGDQDVTRTGADRCDVTASGADILFVSLTDPEAHCHARNVTMNAGCASFDVLFGSCLWCRVQLSVPGMHNVSNALCAAAACHRLGVSPADFTAGLLAFHGTHRRFEHKGFCNGAEVIDDYAHHPTEIRATLKAARESAEGRIVCVFQPHTYTRTHELFDDFTKAFADCDEVIIADIYAAREPDTGLIHSSRLAEGIAAETGNARYVGSLSDIAEILRQKASPGMMILTMGAGDVYTIADSLVQGSI